MAEITLLRHGQASFGAADYDQLSELGQRQAQLLGEQLRQLGQSYDRIVLGSMLRHRQTNEGVLTGLGQQIPMAVHEGLNEYDFQRLLISLRQQHPALWADTGHARRDYYHNMKQALSFWMDGTIDTDGRDSWVSFCQRVAAGFAFAHTTDAKRILVVSSGGPISVILRSVLKLDDPRTRDLTLQIKNSSTSKLLYNRKSFALDSLNDVSHLLIPGSPQLITFS